MLLQRNSLIFASPFLTPPSSVLVLKEERTALLNVSGLVYFIQEEKLL